jgi:hypothetical protein
MIWQIHVYGTARSELAKWCADRSVKLHGFAWEAQHEAAGLARDALYLLRPDTYVALADDYGAPEASIAIAPSADYGSPPNAPVSRARNALTHSWA